jgi:hypothetical protein
MVHRADTAGVWGWRTFVVGGEAQVGPQSVVNEGVRRAGGGDNVVKLWGSGAICQSRGERAQDGDVDVDEATHRPRTAVRCRGYMTPQIPYSVCPEQLNSSAVLGLSRRHALCPRVLSKATGIFTSGGRRCFQGPAEDRHEPRTFDT